MRCEECQGENASVTGFTEDAKTQIECTDCGFNWVHGPTTDSRTSPGSGGTKHFCPVCPSIFSDPDAPIVTIGKPNALAHRCDRTKSYALNTTYGRSDAAMDTRLATLSDADLAGWPRVLEMKRERLGPPQTSRP